MDRRRALLVVTPLAAVTLVVAAVVVTRSDGGPGETKVAAGSDETTSTVAETTTTIALPAVTTTTAKPKPAATTTTLAKAKVAVVASGEGWKVVRTSGVEECIEIVAVTTTRQCGLAEPAHVAGPLGVLATSAGYVFVAVTSGAVTTADLSYGGAAGVRPAPPQPDPFLDGVRILTHPITNRGSKAEVVFRRGDDPLAMARLTPGSFGRAAAFSDDRPTFGVRTNYRRIKAGLSWGIHEFGAYDGAGGTTCIVFRRLVPLVENEAPATTGDACLPATGRKPIEAAAVLATSKPGFVDVFAAFTAEVDGWEYASDGRPPGRGSVQVDPRDPTVKVPIFDGSMVVAETAETLTLIATKQGVEVARVEVPIPKHS